MCLANFGSLSLERDPECKDVKQTHYLLYAYLQGAISQRKKMMIVDWREGRMYNVSDTAFQAFPILLVICIKTGLIHHTRELVQIGWY